MSERAKTLREKLIAALSNKDGELCDHFGEASPEKMADAALSVITALAEDDAAVERSMKAVLKAWRQAGVSASPELEASEIAARAAIRALGE